MRITLAVNAASGSAPEGGDLAATIHGCGHEVQLIDIDALGTAAAACERLVVAGGDGSIGSAAAAAASCGAALAVIPAGTANDFARALGLPDDADAALALACDPDARMVAVDLARADGAPFLNAASWGLAVAAAKAADPLKGALGPLAYAAGALRAGATEDPVGVHVTIDGRSEFEGDAFQVIVAGTGAFGGGSELDAADHGDGLLDVAVVPAGSRAGLVRRAAGMRRGDLTDQDDVVHARGAEVSVEVLSGRDAANVDGELRDPAPRRLTTGAEQVMVVVP